MQQRPTILSVGLAAVLVLAAAATTCAQEQIREIGLDDDDGVGVRVLRRTGTEAEDLAAFAAAD